MNQSDNLVSFLRSFSSKHKIIITILLFIFAISLVPSRQTNNPSNNFEPQIKFSSITLEPTSSFMPTKAQNLKAVSGPIISPMLSSSYSVLKVIDGDTIDVQINGQKETLRLIGIDTPEVVDPRKTVQCYGKEASAKAKQILNGKEVHLEADITQGERDKYSRLLRYVFLEDGTNFNELMIKEGYAHEYTYQSNPYKYQLAFIKAQSIARINKMGLWANNACSAVEPTKKSGGGFVGTGDYSCDCSKTCGQMSCDEAYYQLNQCGCSQRDGDSDGVPCESQCR